VRRTTLPGGLRVVTEYIPSVHSASVGVWVGVGARDEGRSVAGAAHFLEHLLFKSTPTRTAFEIAQAVDAVGGELNAFTAREHTCYYAHVLDTELALAVDLVADVVLRGRCAADDVELERDVVLEEIAMRDDDPEDTLGDVFLSAMFGEHPVGRPVIGSVESVSGMTRAQLHSFHVRRYIPERMVVAVAGNVEHDEVVDAFRLLGDLVSEAPAAPRVVASPGAAALLDELAQARDHVVLVGLGALRVQHQKNLVRRHSPEHLRSFPWSESAPTACAARDGTAR